VALTPQDIVRKEFREAFRGYNQADVDLFLDDVVEEFQRTYEENQKMKVRLAALQQEVARLREGRGGEAPPPAPSAEGAARLEGEVRDRVRRFLEEQIRLLDAASAPQRSATVERIAREVPPPPEEAAQLKDEPEREPFWAGE
jgi:DivIVA domain-containing protein